MNNDDLDFITQNINLILDNFPEISVVILFGSAAKKQLKITSDLDIAIAGNKPISYERKSNLIFSLIDKFSCKIDLIDLQEVSGPILQQALCKGIVIKKTDTVLFASLLRKMWYNQEDMMPYSRKILKRHCQKFING